MDDGGVGDASPQPKRTRRGSGAADNASQPPMSATADGASPGRFLAGTASPHSTAHRDSSGGRARASPAHTPAQPRVHASSNADTADRDTDGADHDHDDDGEVGCA